MQLPYQTLTPTYLHPPTSPLTYFPAANLRPQAFYGHRSRQQTRRTNLVGQFDDRKRCCYSKSKLASLGMGWPLDKAHCKDVDGLLNPSFRQRGLCPYKIRPPCHIANGRIPLLIFARKMASACMHGVDPSDRCHPAIAVRHAYSICKGDGRFV